MKKTSASPKENPSNSVGKPTRKEPPRCNSLSGKVWLQNSISVWSDLRKTTEESRLKHPAMFPIALAERLIASFLPQGSHVVLDPFCGSGSTLLAAMNHGKSAIGLELSPEYANLARSRIEQLSAESPANPTMGSAIVHQRSAGELGQLLATDSIDLCITSPPYWNILNQRRTADAKTIRHYGNLPGDLGVIESYTEFLDGLAAIFEQVFRVLKPGAHCCAVVMDLRKRNRFYPFHADLASRLQPIGFELDDLIIWNRQAEYNNLRPLGYPAVFRVNKVHEFIVLLRKP